MGGALCLDLGADRLVDLGEAAARDPGQDPLEDQRGERITRGEVLVACKRDLGCSVGRAHPRPLDADPAATERHRSVLGAVAVGSAIGVVSALRSADLGDLGGHDLLHGGEAEADRDEALPGGAGELTQRGLDRSGQISPRRLVRRRDLGLGYLLHRDSSCPLGLG